MNVKPAAVRGLAQIQTPPFYIQNNQALLEAVCKLFQGILGFTYENPVCLYHTAAEEFRHAELIPLSVCSAKAERPDLSAFYK